MPEPAWRSLFRDRDFLRLWLAGLAVFVVRWLETLAVGVFAYTATHSAFVVAMLTMLRLLPMGLFGAFLGAMAERMDRRQALLIILLSQIATSAAIATLALFDAVEVWHLALASFMNGIGWAADNPVRRAMIGQVAGPPRMSAAMSIDVATSNGSRVLGPTLGGAVLALVGLDGAFLLSVVLYLPALVAVLRLTRTPPAAGASATNVLASIAEGLAMVRREPRLIGALLVTLLFNLFGWPATSMIPVIGQDRLALGPTGIGLLAGMDGAGDGRLRQQLRQIGRDDAAHGVMGRIGIRLGVKEAHGENPVFAASRPIGVEPRMRLQHRQDPGLDAAHDLLDRSGRGVAADGGVHFLSSLLRRTAR